MNEKMKKLGDAELQIMQVIWRAGAPVTSNYILEHLQGKRTWGLSTLMTSLARLVEKGFLSCDRTFRNNLYSPLIQEEAYKVHESKSFLQKLYGNSLQGLVTTLYGGRAINDSDIQQLRQFLDELEKEGR